MEAWDGVRDGFEFGSAAPQASIAEAGIDDAMARLMAIPVAQSEDCLYLNLWSASLNGARPVMVWIHGGAFAARSSGQPVYLG